MKYIYIILSFAIIYLIPNSALAHVRYLVDEEDVAKNSGIDNAFLLSPLMDIKNIGLMIGTIAIALLVFYNWHRVPFLKNRINYICKRATTYKVFIPWILRLSAGISLIGSGVSEVLISPALTGFGAFATLQILLGFLFITGFLVIPTALASIFLYFLALQVDPYIVGNLDFFAIVLALVIVENERPGIDDLIGMPHYSPFKRLKSLVPFIMRMGIGVAMVYLAIYEKILNPHISEIIVREFGLMNVFPVSPEMWVLSVGIIEFVIGFLLIVGFKTRLMSAVAFVVLSGSFFYFGEDVTSHITLFGVLAILFITEGGSFSYDKKYSKSC